MQYAQLMAGRGHAPTRRDSTGDVAECCARGALLYLVLHLAYTLQPGYSSRLQLVPDGGVLGDARRRHGRVLVDVQLGVVQQGVGGVEVEVDGQRLVVVVVHVPVGLIRARSG